MRIFSYINSLAIENLVVWTSWLKRTVQTAQHIKGHQERWKTLNEIDAGDCDGLTYNDIKERFPEEFACRDVDKFMYRFYPSYKCKDHVVVQKIDILMAKVTRIWLEEWSQSSWNLKGKRMSL